MAWMLHTLDLRDGHRILEIGTGTGYNAALLCERLGSDHVTTVEIDPHLASQARERLARLGCHPAVVTGDGREGHPPGGPYDRIIATTSWPCLPTRWIGQMAPGGKILTNITGLLGGAMLLADVTGDGTATGRFLPRWAGFMVARPTIRRAADIHALDTEEGTYDTGTTRLDPALLHDPAFAFTAQLHTGDARPYWGTHEDGRELCGLISPDGSWAEIYPPGNAGQRHTEQGGPRRLWDLSEQAHQFWQDHGQPNWSRYGVTATSTTQHAWFEDPASDHTWPLPTP
jgi:protein-L-isoaspartate(D-aspartate) O-methyltransferase